MDYELKEGDRLDAVLPGLEVVDTPGHSRGHCSFWHAERSILFGGDLMMRTPSGRLVLPLSAATPDKKEAKVEAGATTRAALISHECFPRGSDNL